MIPTLARPYSRSGYQMIHGVEIRNYKCFRHLKIERCKRINLIVGDNGAGKTALLEAIFLTLAGNAQTIVRNRQARGFDGAFSGSTRMIEDALWGDLFHNFETKNPISVILTGSETENRSVFISKGSQTTLVPLEDTRVSAAASQFKFIRKAANGQEYDGTPSFVGTAFSFPPENEHLPDYFYFAATTVGGAGENAARFSELSKAAKQKQFVELFTKEYPWIEDLSIEITAGQPVIHATLHDMTGKIPLNSISSGINRLLSILLAMASHPKSVICVDEIENGLYHKHQSSFWRWLLSFSQTFDNQLFLSTHSEEWLQALVSIANEQSMKDIAFWRIERDEKGKAILHEFEGMTLKAGVEQGAEVRGGRE